MFIMNDPDDSGDSVTDVLSWVQQQVPSSWLADPNSGLPFWQPFIHAAATAAARQADQDIRILLDDLRGASWATLANALEQLIADPATYLVPQDLEHPERVIIQHVLDELERRADCSRWRVAR